MKILILDIGNYSIKSVYLYKKYKNIEILNYSETRLINDPSLSKLERLTNTLKQIKSTNGYEPEKTVYIYPSEKTTNRFISLPFKDKKRISMTLPLELEEQLPFEIENIIYDWQIVEVIERLSRLSVSVTTKTDLSLFIDAVSDIGLEPDIIVPGEESLFALINVLNLAVETLEIQKEENVITEYQYLPFAIVDIGHSKTNILIASKNNPRHVRTINYGGHIITQRIADEYQLSYEDAENFKIESGYIILDNEDIGDYTDDQIRFSNTLREAYDIIIRDINQAVSNFKANEKELVSVVFLIGSGGKVNNFIGYLEQELKVRVEPLMYASALSLPFTFSNQDEELLYASVVGSSLKYMNKTAWKGFNLRRGEFAKESEIEGLSQYIQLFKPTLKNIATALVLFFIYSFTHSFILDSMEENYKDEIQVKFKKAFPDKGKRATSSLLNDNERLLKEIKNRFRVQKTILEDDISGDIVSSFDILRDLSKIIPKNTLVDIKELHINKRIVKIVKGIASNATIIKNIVQSMEKSDMFTDIKQGNIVVAIDGVNKEFNLTANYKGKK